MTLKLRYISLGAVCTAMFLTAMGIFYVAKANPSFFIRQQSASATTTVTYQTAGTATTTLTFDTGVNTAGNADSAVLAIQFAGSSTAAVLNTDIQYSQDGIDWYATSYGWNGDLVSTSTPTIGSVSQYALTFASSTITRGLVTNANSATTTRTLRVPTPTRYVRAIFSLATGSTNGAFWAEFIAKRQAAN